MSSQIKDYRSETVEADYLSDAKPEEYESLIGKTIAKVEATEFSLTLIFTDESTLTLVGAQYGDCALETRIVEKS